MAVEEEQTGPEETETSVNETEEEKTETENTEEHNVIEVNGSVLVLPEEYEYISQKSDSENFEFLLQTSETQMQAVEKQTELLQCGFLCISFLLGALIGVVLVQGFRLRRV